MDITLRPPTMTIMGREPVCRIPIELNADVSRKLEEYAAALGGTRHKGKIVTAALEDAVIADVLDDCLERCKPRPTGRPTVKKTPDNRITHTLRIGKIPISKVTRYANKNWVSRSVLIEAILIWWFKRKKAKDLEPV